MLRIHNDSYVPKYINGYWLWDRIEDKLRFESIVKSQGEPRRSGQAQGHAIDKFVDSNGFLYKSEMNQIEEMIFRQEFQRPVTTYDGDVILIQDIKNLVLYLAPAHILTKNFIRFVHTREVDRFFKALIIYFEYFLKFVEFVLIRRDVITGPRARVQSYQSIQMKRVFASHLSQYRMILAREYSAILFGKGDMAPYYHMTPVTNMSRTIKDRAFHETFLAFAQQIVWIAMHRRAYDVIEAEMGRLFRSEHFKIMKKEAIQFSIAETSLLYGKNYRRANYRAQNSPLIQELAHVERHNLPLLWIGERKYRGTDLRVMQVELEYIVPESQLCLIDVVHGILGHPKKLYDTMLRLRREAVRNENYSENHDPYHIVRQPDLDVPDIDEEKLRKHAKKYESFYQIKSHFEKLTPKIHKRWFNRDQIIEYVKSGDMLIHIWKKCEHEVENTTYGRSVDEIIAEFIHLKKELRKK